MTTVASPNNFPQSSTGRLDVSSVWPALAPHNDRQEIRSISAIPFGLGLEQTGLQHGSYAAEPKLFQGTIQLSRDFYYSLLIRLQKYITVQQP